MAPLPRGAAFGHAPMFAHLDDDSLHQLRKLSAECARLFDRDVADAASANSNSRVAGLEAEWRACSLDLSRLADDTTPAHREADTARLVAVRRMAAVLSHATIKTEEGVPQMALSGSRALCADSGSHLDDSDRRLSRGCSADAREKALAAQVHVVSSRLCGGAVKYRLAGAVLRAVAKKAFVDVVSLQAAARRNGRKTTKKQLVALLRTPQDVLTFAHAIQGMVKSLCEAKSSHKRKRADGAAGPSSS